MRFRTAAFLTIAALALASPPIAAQGFGPPAHGPHRSGADPIVHMMQELGLDDAQMTQVKAVTAKYMDGSLGDAMDRSREARLAVQKLVHDVTAKDDQVREAAAVVAALEAQSAVQHHRMAIEISAILTAEQRAKLQELFANMAERHGGPPHGDSGGF